MGEGAAVGIRARNRAAIEDEILQLGRRQLAHCGAAGLSLRAVARDLGMASSAVYRYVASRDELLTRLIIAAYTALADEVDAALAQAAEADPREQFRVVGRAMRRWALAHPHEYALLYGSPVPQYHAPADRTVAPGTRVQLRLLRILADLQLPATAADPGTERALANLTDDPLFVGFGADALRRALASWTLLLGTLSTEVFDQLGPSAVAADDYFEMMLDTALGIVG